MGLQGLVWGTGLLTAAAELLLSRQWFVHRGFEFSIYPSAFAL